MLWPVLLIIASALETSVVFSADAVGAIETAYVAETPFNLQHTTLVEALRDPGISRIVLLSDVQSCADNDRPIFVTRNVTIASHDLSSMHVWNTRCTRSSIRLCSTCILKLEGIAIATDRQDIEISFDDISGEPSTDGRQWPQIHLYNCELRRRVCAGPAAGVAQMQAFARSLAWAGKQQLTLTNYTLRGSKLRNRLMVDAVSTRRGRTFLEGSGWRGGYDVIITNVSRSCHTYADTSCGTSDQGANGCGPQLMQDVKAAAAAAEAATAPGKHVPRHVGTFVGPVMVGLAVLLLAVGCAWWRPKRPVQQPFAGAGALNIQDSALQHSSTTQGPVRSCCGESLRHESSLSPSNPSSSRSGHPGMMPAHVTASSASSGGTWKLLHAYTATETSGGISTSGADWAVLSSSTTDAAGKLAEIHLGPMLGAGSYGRVYRGSWRGKVVAVKLVISPAQTKQQLQAVGRHITPNTQTKALQKEVIDHFEGRGSTEVGNEARMLISLSHDNIVKAFSFLTCSWVPNSSLGVTRSSVSQLLSTGWESQQQQQQQQPILTAASGAAACASSAQHQPLQQGQQLKQAPLVPPAKPPAHPATGLAGGAPLAPPTAGSSQSSTCISMATGQQRGSGLLAGSVKPAAGAGQGVSAAAIMDPFLQAPGQEANASSTCRAPACTSNALTAAVCEQQILPFGSEVTGLMQDTSDSSSNNQQPAEYSARTWMVTEYCDGGPMLEALHKLQEVLSPTSQEFMGNMLLLLEGAAKGMEYVHSRNIVHGDLNGHNVLVCTRSKGFAVEAVAKVSDFGLSRTVVATHRTTQTHGTITHMSPERLSVGRMSPAADVYAFGMMMWESYTGRSAFQGLYLGQVCQVVSVDDARPEVPADMPIGYRELMERCWQRRPEDRPTMAQVVTSLQQLLADLCKSSTDESVAQTTTAAVAAIVSSTATNNLMLPQSQWPDEQLVQDLHQQQEGSRGNMAEELHLQRLCQQQQQQQQLPRGQGTGLYDVTSLSSSRLASSEKSAVSHSTAAAAAAAAQQSAAAGAGPTLLHQDPKIVTGSTAGVLQNTPNARNRAAAGVNYCRSSEDDAAWDQYVSDL